MHLKPLNEKYTVIPLASSTQLEKLINQAKLIVTRAGYSSLMDFDVLKKKVLMIPTPGQKEQEYLAELHLDNPLINFCKQDSDLQAALFKL